MEESIDEQWFVHASQGYKNCPLLKNENGHLPTFEKVLKRVRTLCHLLCPKKVGFWPFYKMKSGLEKFVAFSQNGTFLTIFASFWAIYANFTACFNFLPTFPLLFII